VQVVKLKSTDINSSRVVALNKIRSIVPRSLEEVERVLADCLTINRHDEVSQSARTVHHLESRLVVCFFYVGV
jgi:hypothetical protein